MNTYHKFVPNVFLAKCEEKYESGQTIKVTTKYEKENECIVWNLIFERDGFFFYSITRADGFNSQEWAKRRAEKLQERAAKKVRESESFRGKADTHKDFLSLAEPIKVGHHSEKRHRKIIEKRNSNLRKSFDLLTEAERLENLSNRYEHKSEEINLSIPESIDWFEFRLFKAKDVHARIKSGEIEKAHMYSLSYAKKEVKELEKKLDLAKKLWGDNSNG